MRVLVACEFSGAVRRAFRQRGHDAWSCDLVPAEDGSPFHIQDDVLAWLTLGVPGEYVYGEPWEMLIAHPPCTHLAVGGARYWKKKQADGRQQSAAAFFMVIAESPISRIAIENPVGFMSKAWRKPDQIIQPWQFGHEANKPTCLWLKGLPKLVPTKVVGRGEFYTKASGRCLAKWSHITSGTKSDRAKIASRTFEGVAQAMAEQWGTPTQDGGAS